MHGIPDGLWIGLAVFAAVMLICMEVQLNAILGLLQELRDRFVVPEDD